MTIATAFQAFFAAPVPAGEPLFHGHFRYGTSLADGSIDLTPGISSSAWSAGPLAECQFHQTDKCQDQAGSIEQEAGNAW